MYSFRTTFLGMLCWDCQKAWRETYESRRSRVEMAQIGVEQITTLQHKSFECIAYVRVLQTDHLRLHLKEVIIPKMDLQMWALPECLGFSHQKKSIWSRCTIVCELDTADKVNQKDSSGADRLMGETHPCAPLAHYWRGLSPWWVSQFPAYLTLMWPNLCQEIEP